jgi:hypothetical protein
MDAMEMMRQLVSRRRLYGGYAALWSGLVFASACASSAPAQSSARPAPAPAVAAVPAIAVAPAPASEPAAPCVAPADGAVNRSGVYSPDYEAAQAFDADPNSMWISAVYETPAWIAYRAPDPLQIVTGYTLHFVNGKLTSRAPRDWQFLGWTTKGWVTLDQRAQETGWKGKDAREYRLARPGAYDAYCLVVTDDNDERAGVVVVSLGTLALSSR